MSTDLDRDEIELSPEISSALRETRALTVLTGAGISAESGVPTFRDAQTGLWARHDPAELATAAAFERNPELVWNWYTWRRELIAGAEPNPGHLALVELEARVPEFTLATQNVDGLHRRAGSRAVLELHGSITDTRCFECSEAARSWDLDATPPRCAHCGGPLRPAVVWFGEALPTATLDRALEAARRCDLFLCVGTSALVQPAASLPFEALSRGAIVIEVNPDPTPLTPHASHVIHAKAGEALPALLRARNAAPPGAPVVSCPSPET